MILAGIDEAGYGPLLGPLVVGCSAFEVSNETGEDLPCLWKRLRKLVSRKKSPHGKRLHINDSKLVYTPSAGLKELERAVLCFTTTTYRWPESLEDLLSMVSADALSEIAAHPWYEPADTAPFPVEHAGLSLRLFSNALTQEMAACGARCIHLSARVVPEKQLNRMFAQTRNKASTLFSLSAIHLDHLLRTAGDKDLVIFCDRQGGREHYGSLLRLMFEEWSLEIISESPELAEYRLLRGQHAVRLIFREKAEMQCLAVAMASMLSKYLREALMRRFNAFWRSHLPELTPTAGYYGDGSRFLRDIDQKRRELEIPDESLIRCR